MASGTTPASQTLDTPEAATLLLATFAELYRHEVGAEEDVHRTLPFFGTALVIVVTALAYAAAGPLLAKSAVKRRVRRSARCGSARAGVRRTKQRSG